MIKENSGYSDKNGEQIYFGEKCAGVCGEKSAELEKSEYKHPAWFSDCVFKDTGEFPIDGILWRTDWGGLPVIPKDFKTCEIIK